MAAKSDFVHLHLHTEYSLLDGAISLDKLFPRLQEFGMDTCAITDHGNMYGVVQFYKKATAAGIKPIIGVETYVARGSRLDKTPSKNGRSQTFHQILLADSPEGYRNLCHLVSKANLEGFYYHPRVDKELLEQHSEGLIALSACLSGEIPTLILEGRMDEALNAADWYRQVFGKENFYLELQHNGIPEQEKVNEALLEIHKKTGIPIVATNDSHFLKADQARAHEILVCIQTQKTILDENRMKMTNHELYLKSPVEMEKAFGHLPDSLKNTRAIADRCHLEMTFGDPQFPNYVTPKGESLDEFLYDLARRGVNKRLDDEYSHLNKAERKKTEAEWIERLDIEMDLIRDKGYAGYFLIVYDFINHARQIGVPVGPGRGSAAGSLLSYAIGITDIDPIRWGLLFERFLNPERADNPDIDIDFCAHGREKIIEYVTEKYGKEHVAQISTFGTMKAKAVIRDVGRAMGRQYGEVDVVAKLIPDELKMTLDKAFKAEPRLLELLKTEPWVNELLDIARPLEGLNRHASTHAAGIVIGNMPLVEYLPLYKGSEGEVVTQFDKKDVESVGLVKFDFLGLKTLTVIDKAMKLIKATEGKAPDLSKIPIDDKETFELLQRGDTTGVFQFESSGMKELLVKSRPEVFEDIISLAALYRPGPLGSGMVDDFIERKHGRAEVVYDHPILEDMLKETYGVMVYQEQVMQVARAIGGFSLGESDLLRRAMAKKKVEKMGAYQIKFLEGAKNKKIDQKVAKEIFDKMAKFAEYGFNKSHSAAYAMVAYHTAYLKAHFPAQFMAGLMSMDVHDSDKLMVRLQECREMKLTVSPPDVNKSLHDFNVADGKILFGLAAIKGVGDGAIQSLLEARERVGKFEDLYGFCEEVDMRAVNRRALESMIKAGTFDTLGGHRAQLLAGLEPAIERAATTQRDRSSGQVNMFDAFAPASSGEGGTKEPLPNVPAWENKDLLAFEKEALGFYLTGHPLEDYADVLRNFMTADLESIRSHQDKRQVTIAGIITSRKFKETKRGGQMVFLGFEDLRGTTEVIVFPKALDGCREVVESDKPVAVKGTTDPSEKGVKILADEIILLHSARELWSREVIFLLRTDRVTGDHLRQLKQIVDRHPGTCKGVLHVRIPHQSLTVVAMPSNKGVAPTADMVSEVRELLGDEAVMLR